MTEHELDRAMWRHLAPALLIGLASCGGADRSGDQAMASLTLRSSAFGAGDAIPAAYTCEGANQSPPLTWSEPPGGTRSFVLIVDDPDAPSGTFRHWGAYDIPSSARSLEAGKTMGLQADNDFGKPGYGGPCPPKGHGVHHYHFKLYALDVERLGVPPNPKIATVESEANSHAIGKAELIGTYERR